MSIILKKETEKQDFDDLNWGDLFVIEDERIGWHQNGKEVFEAFNYKLNDAEYIRISSKGISQRIVHGSPKVIRVEISSLEADLERS